MYYAVILLIVYGSVKKDRGHEVEVKNRLISRSSSKDWVKIKRSKSKDMVSIKRSRSKDRGQEVEFNC